ncbi:PBS lyase [Caldimicrobium thiodismutans]|jgi:hypothetical protein|uniref:PBS lyase n=1 Tax=Caldimicrobium thiodismutans TaxID=1653476 RepID=A0A0U5B7S2_9BACT|nr:DVU0298 family protein [Caldimicrobium thiodismutans]BAU24144.1 PBS lyase [Caldimicrobium thiodismutans]
MKLKIPKPPLCPFCGRLIPKPTFLPIGFSDYEAGICECGAVYVADVTGFSRGAVFLEALLIACGGDLDLALDLIPEEDYQEIWLENYDPESHTLPPESHYEGRKIKGALCFIKLANDLEELKSRERAKALSKKEIETHWTLSPQFKKRLTRKEAENLLLENRKEELLAYSLSEPLNLQTIQKLLYHPEETMRKKASVSIGYISNYLSQRDPERVLDFLKRLLYASADSAASPWGAIEAVGEIIRETETRYIFFVKNLFGFLAYPEYETSVLYALMRMAEKNPFALKKGPYLRLLNIFKKAKPLAQALIIKIFTYLKGKELLSYKEHLQPEKVSLFDYDTLSFKEVYLKDLWKTYEKTATTKEHQNE